MAYRNYSTNNGFIVSADGTADFTTIQAAITASSSGQTIFIRKGTYTENLTLKIGVSLTAFLGDSLEPNVTIIGKCTATGVGTYSISNIKLQTNSDFLLAVTGSDASIVNLNNCNLNCSNNTGISHTSSSSSSSINLFNCQGNLGTTGIAIFVSTSAGNMGVNYCKFTNSGASTTASSTSTGIIQLFYSTFNSVFSSSSTGTLNIKHSVISCTSINTACVTTAGTGAAHQVLFSNLLSGTASAISIGSGTTLVCYESTVDSTNTNAITGAGTLVYSSVSFSNTSSTINTTTKTGRYTQLSQYRASEQPCFSANRSANVTNVTGNGTLATVVCDNVIFDQNSNYNNSTGIFTAPVTGRYYFEGSVQFSNCTIGTIFALYIVGTSRSFQYQNQRAAGANPWQSNCSCILDMTANDTCKIQVQNFGEAAATQTVVGQTSNYVTYFTGHLIC